MLRLTAPPAVERDLLTWVVILVFIGGVAGSCTSAFLQMYQRRKVVAERRPCFECGTSCRDAVLDEGGAARCPACGASIHQGQWGPPVELAWSGAWPGIVPATVAAVGVWAASVLIPFIVLFVSFRFPAADKLLEAWQRIGPSSRS